MIYKNDINIEEDVYIVAKSFFDGILGGKVYREGCRPIDSQQEDAVVSIPFADVEQIQNSGVYINVYVIDKKKSGRYVPDKTRLTEISDMTEDLLMELNSKYIGEYDFEIEKTTKIFAEPSIKQHRVSINFSIKRITFNDYGKEDNGMEQVCH